MPAHIVDLGLVRLYSCEPIFYNKSFDVNTCSVGCVSLGTLTNIHAGFLACIINGRKLGNR